MSLVQLVVTLLGAASIGAIVWFFWFARTEGVHAALTSGGYQEAMILVKGGYSPDRIIVERDVPVRLTFRREETAVCSEMVIFDGLDRSAQLPEGQPVAVELMPTEPGEYPFACQMGMYRGTLVVR